MSDLVPRGLSESDRAPLAGLRAILEQREEALLREIVRQRLADPETRSHLIDAERAGAVVESERRYLRSLAACGPDADFLAERRRRVPEVKKVGGDLIVPFSRLPEMVHLYQDGFGRRGLPFAIWGHLSDGNLHPNALPRSAEEVRLGFEALMEFADRATRLGGCPLSEHGVGRSRLKQSLLREFYGAAAIDQMRAVKNALDPEWRLAPGVLFDREDGPR